MQFKEFLQSISKIQKQPLPGMAAHAKMAPATRIEALRPDYYSDKNPKMSSVMMLVYPKNNEASFVLIKRNTYKGVHSAQISLPGGKKEEEDTDAIATALRETHEEIGVAPVNIEIVKLFSEIYIPPSNFLVHPVLGYISSTPEFIPEPAEVDMIIEMPVSSLLDDSFIVNTTMKTSYANMTNVPAFKIDEHIVWGATAMILSEIKETIKKVL